MLKREGSDDIKRRDLHWMLPQEPTNLLSGPDRRDYIWLFLMAQRGPGDHDAIMERWDKMGSRMPTYTIQVGLDMTIGIDGGFLAAQLVDAADNGDIAADVAVEIGRRDARSGLGVHFRPALR